MRKTFDFLEFLGIYMVLAPSASEFLEFFGIYNISGGLRDGIQPGVEAAE